jgi:hypothetical protein
MRKLPAVLVFAAAACVYNCGSSDDHDAASMSAAGESNAGDAGSHEQGGSSSTPTGGSGGESNGNAAGAAGAPEPVTGGSGGESNGNAGGVAGMMQAAGAETGGANAGGAGGATFVELPDGPIVDVPYTCDSPFQDVDFASYFYLEDFEDGTLSTPGVTSTSTTTSANSGALSLVDSVDCDDGVIDGTCTNCDALFSGSGSIQVTFDAQTLGALPTHVGMVWTDGGFGSTVTVTGYDAADQVIYTQSVNGIGDNSNTGTTAEDRFFGIVHYAGVKSVKLANSSGGIEIDHLQYGR